MITNGTHSEAPKKRGRPAGSKNRSKKETASIPFSFPVRTAPAAAITGLEKYLHNRDVLREFFSLPEDVQNSIKILLRWEEDNDVKESVEDTLSRLDIDFD